MPAVARRPVDALSRMERFLATLPPSVPRAAAIERFMGATTETERQQMKYAWNGLWARPSQMLPDGDWDTLFLRAGRGFGKTRSAAEGVRELVNDGRASRIMLIGQTAADARDVMIEGPESGLLAVHPRETRPVYEPSKRLLTWPNGARGIVRSAEEPDACRGPNLDLVWGDEPASWSSGEAAWVNAQLGNRLNVPHSILTGTPRPYPWLRAIEAESGTVVRTGSTYDNVANLAPKFIDLVVRKYEGTRLGAQELHAEYLEDAEGAFWRMATIEAGRFPSATVDGNPIFDRFDPWGSLVRLLTAEFRARLGLGGYVPNDAHRPWVTWVGVDPPGETAECGIVVVAAPRFGRQNWDHAVVLDDLSVAGPPEVWGPQVAHAVRLWGAEGAVVERNMGGDMVRSTVHAADADVVVEKITAVDSKADRAEPISTLYAQGWIHHVGYLGTLEQQMTTWVPGESKSPDRVDALVHALTKVLSPEAIGAGAVGNPNAYG